MDAEEWHGLAVDLTTVLEKRNGEIASLRAAAHQDAEEKARLREALKDALDYIGGLVHPGALPKWFEDARRIAALACAPTGMPNGIQQTEEKARLREALILARREISDHDSDYHHRTRESTIEAIRDALACRPQGEK